MIAGEDLAKTSAVPMPAPLAVLVVDDQASVREGLVRLITASGLPLRGVHAAASRAEALLKVQHHAPEVIVLDIDLAGDDGLALLAQLHGHERVLLLSSHDDPDTRRRALALGAAAFVSKHDPAPTLLRELAALMSR